MTEVRVLPFHAPYKCLHAGACCTSNWPIPIEADRLNGLRVALAAGSLRPATEDVAPVLLIQTDDPVDPPALLGRAAHRCVFFADPPSGSGGRCRIQSALGHDALPLACRQFPRVSVHDPRGTSVTLSHYCPTATGLLNAAIDPDIVEPLVNVTNFPSNAEYSGLDARTTLPPLLRPGMLMDWDSWWACERLAVEVVTTDESAADGLARLRAVVNDLESWSPKEEALLERVETSFRSGRRLPPRVPAEELVAAVYRAIPADLTPPPRLSEPRPGELARRRFLAAHAFANWSIHLRGLRAWLLSVEAGAALIETGLGPRAADLLLRHLTDSSALCDKLLSLTPHP